MAPKKPVIIKLFFNASDNSMYIQIGETLFRAPDKVVTRIQEKEGLEIRHARDIKEIQLLSQSDDEKST